jgi:uncharacterized protein YdgA (DUF945 family)
MKTPAKLAIGLLALAIAYPAASWLTGNSIESGIETKFALMKKQGFDVDYKFERGFFNSSYTYTVSFPSLEGMKLTVHSRIAHRPFAGGLLTLAAFDDEYTFDDSTGIIEFSGGKTLKVSYSCGLTGNAHVAFPFPAFKLKMPDAKDSISISAMEVDMNFSLDMSRIDAKYKIPTMVVNSGNKTLTLSDIQAESNQKRLYDDSVLYTGEDKLTITRLEAQNSRGEQEFQLQQVAFDNKISADGDFVNISTRLRAENLTADKKEFGPASYEQSFKHLHGRTLSSVLDEFANLARRRGAVDSDNSKVLADLGLKLLEHNPAFRLDRLAFRTPEGESTLTFSVALKDFKAADVANLNIPALLFKLNVNGEVSLPLALVRSQNDLDQLLGELVKKGFVQAESDPLKITLTFEQGQASINGKPYNPLAELGIDKRGSRSHDDDDD